MKPTLLFTAALFAALTIKAQNNPPAPQATPAPQTQQPVPPKPDTKGCVLVPPPQFKLPPKVQAMLDKQKADFQRKTGIVLPPPPPPKPKLVCPPAQPPTPITPGQGAPAAPVPANQ